MTGQRDGVEEVGADRDHHVDGARLDQLPADLALRVAGVAGRVRHDEAGPARVVERRVELLDPEVVARCPASGCPNGKRGSPASLSLSTLVDVERRIGHHEVERADRAVRVFVVAVGQADVAGQAVQRQVHLGERDGALLLLGAVDRQLASGGLVVALDELGALDEHAARPARGVVDLAVERFDDLDDQPDDRVRREELTAEATLARSEVGEEVLVDQPERVAGQLARQRGEQPKQFAEGGLLEPLVAARQDVPQFGVRALDQLHRLVDGLAEVLALGQVDEV